MLPRQYITIALFVLPLYYFTTRVNHFYRLFHEHSGIAITQEEIVLAHRFSNSTKIEAGKDQYHKQVVPKIIHQVWHNWNGGEERDLDNQTLPRDWEFLRATCTVKNPEWEFKLWTEKASRDLIALNYPWFLSTYDGYKYPVQRADTVRYFLIRHYGGIYLDLDNGCKTSLTPLLYYPAFLTDGGTRSLYNNILGGTPNHPFYSLLTDSLISYDYNYLFPYLTVAYASGQWFETAIWEEYHTLVAFAEKQEFIGENLDQEIKGGTGNATRGDMRLHRVMMEESKEGDWVFFTKGRGGSWVNWDNMLFGWVEDYVIFVPVVLFVGVLGLWVGVAKFWQCFRRRTERSYEKVRGKEDDEV